MQDGIERFLTSLEVERGFSANTIAAYRNDLNQFAGYLTRAENGHCAEPLHDWRELGEHGPGAYLEHLVDRSYASSTVARKTAAIKSFCAWLNAEGITDTDLGELIAAPRVDKYVPRGIEPEDVAKLLAAPSKLEGAKPEALRDRAMMELLYATGMRVGELVALDVEDLHFGVGTVVCAGKAGRTRRLPLTSPADEALTRYLKQARKYLARPEERSLFVNYRGGRLTRQGLWLILKSYARKVGIRELTPHTLRHSFAIHALRRGADIHDVQRVLGHVSVSTTQMYRELARQRN